jgi:two-component system CheB/CheR fusion protein
LTVRDVGQGIDAAFLPRIFEMFGQAPNRALSGKGGLGIGLALVRQLAELQGGHIDAESPGPGQGSTFKVCLPRFEYGVVGPSGSAATEPLPQDSWRGVRVLIADDAVDAADTFGRLLAMDGAEVTVAGDGEEALAKFEQQPFDIVFADIGMPKMDGYELADRIRELPKGRNVPLVALTGFTRSHDVQRAEAAGFDAHLGKPLSIGALHAAMQRLLGDKK